MTPPSLPPDSQRAVVRERLRLLSIGYYISGAIGAISVSFLIFHLIIFGALSFIPEPKWNVEPRQVPSQSSPQKSAEPPRNSPAHAMPVIFLRVAVGAIALVIAAGWVLGGLTIYAGRCIRHRRNRTFILIIAGINCVWIPYGTLLGIATFLTLFTADAISEFNDGQDAAPNP